LRIARGRTPLLVKVTVTVDGVPRQFVVLIRR
jgi:hypothetical protein